MARIVAGRLKTEEQAEQVMRELCGHRIADRDMQTFYVGPAGQHDAYPLGGDAASDAGAKQAGFTAIAGAVIGALFGGGLGAVIAFMFAFGLPVDGRCGPGGSRHRWICRIALRRVLSGTKNPRKQRDTVEHPVARRAGAMVAVHISRPETEEAVITALEAHGATDIERAEGEWYDGEWRDFDPVNTGVRCAARMP